MTPDETAWDSVWNRYITASSEYEKDDLLYSLCQTADATRMHRPVHINSHLSK